jgi:plastocyanin
VRNVLLYLLAFALGLGAALLVASLGAVARAAVDGTLTGSVGTSGDANAFSISLSSSTVPAGTYEFDITDYATVHNFDLIGPDNVSIDKTTISGTGSVVWTVTLSPGVYTYHCDAHPSTMNGTLTVTGGTASTSTTSTTSSTTQITTPPPTTTTGAGSSPLKVRIASVHTTPKVVVVRAAANQLTRVVAILLHKRKRLARAATDGKTVKLRLKPRRALAPGSYVVRVTVVCCGSSATAKKTIRIR